MCIINNSIKQGMMLTKKCVLSTKVESNKINNNDFCEKSINEYDHDIMRFVRQIRENPLLWLHRVNNSLKVLLRF